MFNILNYGIEEQVRLWDGCQSYWKLDETSGVYVLDSIGGNNGYAANTAILNGAGKNNACLDFGAGSYNVKCGNTLNPAAGTFTWSFWMYGKRAPNTASDAFIAKTNGGSAAATYGYQIFKFYYGGTYYFAFAHSTATSSVSVVGFPYSAVTDTQWNHFAIVLGGKSQVSDIKIYMNGVSQTLSQIYGDITQNTGSITNTLQLTFGSESDNSNRCDRKIDEIAMWNRALNSAEVKALYSGGNGKFYGTKPFNWTNLTSYWNFAVTGNTLYDSFGTRNGTVSDINWSASGIRGNCASMKGTAGSNILLAANCFTNAQVVSGSISMWVKKNGVGTSSIGDIVFSMEGYVTIGFQVNTGKVFCTTDGGTYDQYNTINCEDNAWHNVIVTWGNADNAVYVDGVYYGSTATASSPTPDALSRTSGIGCSWGDYFYFIDGYIDEVGFWSNYRLTASEAQQIYNSGNGLFY